MRDGEWGMGNGMGVMGVLGGMGWILGGANYGKTVNYRPSRREGKRASCLSLSVQSAFCLLSSVFCDRLLSVFSLARPTTLLSDLDTTRTFVRRAVCPSLFTLGFLYTSTISVAISTRSLSLIRICRKTGRVSTI